MKAKEDKKQPAPSVKAKSDILHVEQPTATGKKAKTEKEAVTMVKAQAKFLRISPRKLKLVIDLVRGLGVFEALEQLSFLNKKAAGLVMALLKSAMANAEHNFKLKPADLFIKKIVAAQGATFHRFQPAAFGRARPIRKRTAHLEIILTIRESGKPKAPKNKKQILAKKVSDKSEKVKVKQPVTKKEEII